MKKLLFLFTLLAAACAPLPAANTPSAAVTQNPNTGVLNGSLTVGTGNTLSIASGATLSAASGSTLNFPTASVPLLSLPIVDLAHGGTGATTAAGAALALGLDPTSSPAFTALSLSSGSLTGGASGLTLNAGGTNQSISLAPSGTGNVTASFAGSTGLALTTSYASSYSLLSLTNTNTGSGAVAAFRLNVNNGSNGFLIQQASNPGSPAWNTNGYDTLLLTSQSGSYLRLSGGGNTSNPSIAVGATAVFFPLTGTAGGNYSAPLAVAGGIGCNSNMMLAGPLTLGSQLGGSPLKSIRTATATLTFPAIAAGGSQSLTVTVTGAATGDTVEVNRTDGNLPDTGTVLQATVTAANTVTVRDTNFTASPITPASVTYRVTVLSF